MHVPARAFFAAHGITHIERIVTDNGSCCRAHDFAKILLGARHQRISPYTPPQRQSRALQPGILAEEFLYAREWASEYHRTNALAVWNIHYNYHQPHTAAGNRPPASRLPAARTGSSRPGLPSAVRSQAIASFSLWASQIRAVSL
ncbi:integrase core domain-containing protein [Nocardia salmonicida]|uniref:integrase core domain-containing protein n=1 Tax=Nocardia salmonicida TaxID=53431 RepID=UPI0038B3F2F8